MPRLCKSAVPGKGRLLNSYNRFACMKIVLGSMSKHCTRQQDEPALYNNNLHFVNGANPSKSWKQVTFYTPGMSGHIVQSFFFLKFQLFYSFS